MLVAAASCLVLPGVKAAGLPALPPSLSLAVELKDAQRAGNPLVVMIRLDGCVYCRAVRESHLLPMRAQQGLAVVQLDMRSRQLTRDFSGSPTSYEERIRAWKIRLAPTLLFIGPDGSEVADRLPGYSADFYSFYLAERLAQARSRLRV